MAKDYAAAQKHFEEAKKKTQQQIAAGTLTAVEQKNTDGGFDTYFSDIYSKQ